MPRNVMRFTLIELLVVIAIVAILAAMLLPGLQGAKERSRVSVCHSHQKQVAVCGAVYEGDFNFPVYFMAVRSDGSSGFYDYVRYQSDPTYWPQGAFPGMNAMMALYLARPRAIMKCTSIRNPVEVQPYVGYAGWMHCPYERWRPNSGNVLLWRPRQDQPSKFFVLACRSDYPVPMAAASLQVDSGHPPAQQNGIVTLWLDGHTEWYSRRDCQIAHLYGVCEYGETPPASDGYMIPRGFTVTW